MKYTFCTIDGGAGTAWLRAGMIVKYMNFENKRQARWLYDQNNIKESLKAAGKDDCYIFIKTGFDEGIISAAKERCGKVILDISDDFSDGKTSLWTEVADAILYDTDHADQLLEKKGYKNRIKINHLHSNFDQNFSQLRKIINSPKKIGYLGLQSQFSKSQEIIKFVTGFGFGWYQANPNLQNNNLHTAELDMQIVFNENNSDSLRLKPHNKLMNAYSFGIPTLFSPYDSYVEVTKNSQVLSQFCCHGLEDLKEKFAFIVSNEDLFKHASEECFALSTQYHVSKYETCYSGLFRLVES